MIAEFADGFGHWLAGFIDGEGSFLILAYRDPSDRPRFRMRFQLALRDDDASVLYEIVERTGIGEVVTRENHAERCGDVAVWRVVRRVELLALCKILDVYPLRAKKQADYEVWREALRVSGRLYRGGDQRRVAANGTTWERLAELRGMLTDVRSYAFAEPA